MIKIGLLIILFFILLSCSGKPEAKFYSQAQIDSATSACANHRLQKDDDFKQTQGSPLTEDDRKTFERLSYFPYDIHWRFEGTIHHYEKIDSMKIMGSKEGDVRPGVRYAYFEFEKDGLTHCLEIIKLLPRKAGQQEYLFLGFWDKTNGETTYGGGRYIDLEETAPDHYVVDFNYAYNPYCAYNHKYSCAIPPPENRLELAVNAGEQKYKEH